VLVLGFTGTAQAQDAARHTESTTAESRTNTKRVGGRTVSVSKSTTSTVSSDSRLPSAYEYAGISAAEVPGCATWIAK